MHSEAESQIKDWQILFPTIFPSTHTVEFALKAVDEYKLSFWDAMLWSVARENSVTELFSEDFQAGRKLDGAVGNAPASIRHSAAGASSPLQAGYRPNPAVSISCTPVPGSESAWDWY